MPHKLTPPSRSFLEGTENHYICEGAQPLPLYIYRETVAHNQHVVGAGSCSASASGSLTSQCIAAAAVPVAYLH